MCRVGVAATASAVAGAMADYHEVDTSVYFVEAVPARAGQLAGPGGASQCQPPVSLYGRWLPASSGS